MVSTLSWVLLGVGLYWIGLLWLRRQGLLPAYLGTQGPILTVHTRRFRSILDRLAGPKRLWRVWGNFGIGVALVVMAGSFAFLAFAAATTLQSPAPPSAINQPRNVLVIPGVNDFLPLSVAPEIVAGLLIGMIVHEGGHGLFCRVGDIDIESVGIALLAVVPVGAFVEPDDESRRRASRGDQTRMFAAGVMNNFAVTLLAFFLLFGPVAGSIGVASGAAVGGVVPGSAADAAGLDRGDRIVAADDQDIEDNADLAATLANSTERELTVRIDDGKSIRTTTVRRSIQVTGVMAGTPFADVVTVGTAVVAVNNTTVYTERGFREAVGSNRVVTLRTGDGSEATGAVGAAVTISPDGPAASAGLPGGEQAVVTAVDGQRVFSREDLVEALSGTAAGDTVRVEAYVDGTRRTVAVELGSHPRLDHGLLGVTVAPGTSGLTLRDFGAQLYPAETYLGLLTGERGQGSFFGRIIVALYLPLASVMPGAGLPFNFAGFTGGVANFYVVEGPLSAIAGIVFAFANVLFWTGWINLNLGVFNCIPAFPLDGGHILRTSTEAVVARLPVQRRRDLTTVVTTGVGLVMLASLVLTLFGPQLLN